MSNEPIENLSDVELPNEKPVQSFLRGAEGITEILLFSGRWLLAPLYIGLALSLIGLVVKFIEAFITMLGSLDDSSLHTTTLDILELLDITLLGNLIVIVIFSGYENFVSKISVAEDNVDRPSWMGKVDYSGLKIKLIGSLVAISVIELLKDFMEKDTIDPSTEKWRIAIHLTFVASGVLFAIMDYIADKRTAFELDMESKMLDAERAKIELAQMRHEHFLATQGQNHQIKHN